MAVNEQTDPPNEGVIGWVRGQIDGGPGVNGVRERVLQAWKALYKEQRQKNRLPDVLKKQTFREHFEQLMEGKIPELNDVDREYYMNEIQKYFPKLIEEVDVRRPKKPTDKDSGDSMESNSRMGPPAPAAKTGWAWAPRRRRRRA